MAESIIIDGTKCTQIGVSGEDTGLNVRNRLFIDGDEVFPTVGSVNPIEEQVQQIGHGLSEGQIVYSNLGTLEAAQADAEASSNAVARVLQVVDADNLVIQFTGQFATTGLTAGSVYYLSDSVAGAVTTTPPSAPNYVVEVFKAVTTTRATLNIQQGIVGA